MSRDFLTSPNIKSPLLLNGAAGTAGQVLSTQGPGAIPQWVAASGFTGGTLTSNLTLVAGTASAAPLSLQSGTNLTTAAAGAVEYDGKVIYSTPAGRGVSPSMMYYYLNSNVTGADTTNNQSVYGVGVTLQSNTAYAFDGMWHISKTTGTTSHLVKIGWGGTSTFNNFYVGGISYRSTSSFSTTNLMNPLSFYMRNTWTHMNLAGSTSFNSPQDYLAWFKGTITVNTGGTFIPQYSLSTAPGGAYSTLAGSYFSIWPIGASGSNTSVGPWA